MSWHLILGSSVDDWPRFAAKLELIELFLFHRLLDDTDEVLELVNVEQHDLNAVETVKWNFLDYLVILLDLLFKELADKLWV